MLWEDRIETKLGDAGELIAEEHFSTSGSFIVLDRGINLFPEDHPTGGHDIDYFLENLKGIKFYADVKCKPSFTKWPITGMNLKEFKQYWRVKNHTGLKTYVFFVDYLTEIIRGQEIRKLVQKVVIDGETYPHKRTFRDNKECIMFHLDQLKFFDHLSPEEVNTLKNQESYRSY